MIHENEAEMLNGNGRQLAIGNVVVPLIKEPTTDATLTKLPQEGNAPNTIQ